MSNRTLTFVALTTEPCPRVQYLPAGACMHASLTQSGANSRAMNSETGVAIRTAASAGVESVGVSDLLKRNPRFRLLSRG